MHNLLSRLFYRSGILKTKETFLRFGAYFIGGRFIYRMWQNNLKFVIGLEDNGLLIKPLIIILLACSSENTALLSCHLWPTSQPL